MYEKVHRFPRKESDEWKNIRGNLCTPEHQITRFD
jgi:hypothetical protein